MELQGWQTATKLFSGRKKFYCGTDTTGQGRQTLGGTPFADTARGGCDTDPITTSYIPQKNYIKKFLHKPIKLLALCQILFCSGFVSLKNPLYILPGVFIYICYMAYIEHNFFPLKVFVRDEYLYQNTKGQGEFTPGIIVSVRCMPGQAALFQVLLENGALRDKLPSHALLTEPKTPDPDLPFHFLQLWNCFSYNFTLLQLSYLYDTPVEVYMKDHKFYPGSYYATINWGVNDLNTDLSLAEDPAEHKSHHIILLDNGQIALQPNNRIKWSEPSFVTKAFPEKPDYLVCKDSYNCEGFDKWHTEDSDRMFYDTE